MFAIEYHDFDTTIDTKPLQAKFKVIRKRTPDSVIWVCPKKKDLVSFVYELEYDLSNKYPDDVDLKEVREEIFKISVFDLLKIKA